MALRILFTTGQSFVWITWTTLLIILWSQPSACQNNAPVLITTDVIGSFTENDASYGGQLMQTVFANDVDAGDTVTYNFNLTPYTITPAAAQAMIYTNSTSGQIRVNSGVVFDYETEYQIDVHYQATDGTDTSDWGVYSFVVTDEPEAPVISNCDPASPISFGATEGAIGTYIGNAITTLTIYDDDNNEYLQYEIYGGTGQSYFNIDPNSAAITLAVAYDYDSGAFLSTATLLFRVVDKYFLSSTCSLTVTFADINDNTPIFNPTSYTITAGIYTAVGTLFDTVTVTDADSGVNADLTLDVDASSAAGYFGFNGNTLRLAYPIDVNYATTWTFLITATDNGAPQLTGTATVTVITTDTTTAGTVTTVATGAYYNWFANPENVAAFSVLMIALAGLFGMAIFCCWRCHTYGRCFPENCSHYTRLCRDRFGKKKSWQLRKQKAGPRQSERSPRRLDERKDPEKGNKRSADTPVRYEKDSIFLGREHAASGEVTKDIYSPRDSFRSPMRSPSIAPTDIRIGSVTPRNAPLPYRTDIRVPRNN